MLPELSATENLSEHLSIFRGERVSVILSRQPDAADLEALRGLEGSHVALFTPLSSYTLRDRMDQDWTVNDPKTDGQETLYSSTFFFHANGERVQALLDLSAERGWAVYAFDEEQAYCLVLSTKVAFDVDREGLLTHLKEH